MIYNCFEFICTSLEYTQKIHPKMHGTYISKLVMFRCYSFAPVRWEFNNGPLPNNTETKIRDEGDIIYELLINEAVMTNFGSYTCNGMDRFNVKFEETAQLFVFCKSLYCYNELLN